MPRLLLGLLAAVTASVSGDEALKIAFGSCSKVGSPTEVWKRVSEIAPDAWIWMGDNVYLDKRSIGLKGLRFQFGGLDNARKMYSAMQRSPDYSRAMQSVGHILGTWDDHDMGENDAGNSFPHKEATKALTMDFLRFGEDHPARREHGGMYYSQTLRVGTARETKVIMLDTRYYKTKETLLGETQWVWLEEELKACQRTPLCVLVSSIQVVSRWRGSFSIMRMETWEPYPQEMSRLLRLLNAEKDSAVVVLSGDVHHGDLRVLSALPARTQQFSPCTFEGETLAKPFVEVTSSGITHTIGTFLSNPSWFWGNILSQISLEKYAFSEDLQRPFTINKNFGTLQFDGTTVTLDVRGEHEGSVYVHRSFSLDELRGASVPDVAPTPCITEFNSPAPFGMVSLGIVVLLYLTTSLVLFVCLPCYGLFCVMRAAARRWQVLPNSVRSILPTSASTKDHAA
eukprot:Rhum_TRINITY_DN25015_c0_g1::Rhum_TRINITY_DN25015_c0_g1_i1::g.180911::m.180911/K01113/phoD; alkaline phosphatase D